MTPPPAVPAGLGALPSEDDVRDLEERGHSVAAPPAPSEKGEALERCAICGREAEHVEHVAACADCGVASEPSRAELQGSLTSLRIDVENARAKIPEHMRRGHIVNAVELLALAYQDEAQFHRETRSQIARAILEQTADLRRERDAALARAEEAEAAYRVAARTCIENEARATAAERAKDGAYQERDRCVALAARLAMILHWPAWLGRHVDKPSDPPWEDDWRNIVFVTLPSGQVSWHIHDSELPFVNFLPGRDEPWDGHDTAEKYRRCDAPWPPEQGQSAKLTAAERSLEEVRGALRDARAALDRDRTGLAAALNAIQKEIRGRAWMRSADDHDEGGTWGAYAYQDHTSETLRKEIGWAFDAMAKIATDALHVSGRLADEGCRAADAALRALAGETGTGRGTT